MKVLALTLLCAFASGAAGGAVAWPGAVAISSPLAVPSLAFAPAVKTIIPGETRATGYSTTQYINAIPASYSYGAHPQFAVPFPQAAGFAAVQPGYYHVAGSPFVSASNVYYPSQAFGPLISGFGPAPIVPGSTGDSNMPSGPEGPTSGSPSESAPQPPGDADSAVIESADSVPERPRNDKPSEPQAPEAPQPEQPASSSSPSMEPANTFPTFPAVPQVPQGGPSFPSFPQFPQGSPSFPTIPNFPQAPQVPGFPQFPSNLFPQGPSQAPSAFPSAIDGDKGLNDEDTVSVESA